MKKFTLLLMSLLMVSAFAIAQKKLCLHTIYGEKIEYMASDIAYIDFEDAVTDPDDDPVAPETGAFVAMPFSVGENKTVTFSFGNLQYHAANDEWRFAPSQIDYIGEDNANISATYNGWIDLFGWGTGNNPTNISTDNEDYHTFVDWGVNKIGNYAPNTWRTLTYDEWDFVINRRKNADKLFGVALVNGVTGFILLPDGWTSPSGISFKPGFHEYNGIEYYGEYQIISASDWSRLEASGAVFLPATSYYRGGSSVGSIQGRGSLWSATSTSEDDAYILEFVSAGAGMCYYDRFIGYSVRLVQD